MKDKVLGAIWAQTANGLIGRNGDMPWYAPEDLAHFKEVTGRSPVIMGRVTWDSIPDRFRPLPGRLNIVVSRSVASRVEAGGAVWVPHLHVAIAEALAGAGAEQTIWVMGGAAIYEQALALIELPGLVDGRVSVVERTVFNGDLSGDASAPFLSAEWRQVAASKPQLSEGGYLLDASGKHLPLSFRFERWKR